MKKTAASTIFLLAASALAADAPSLNGKWSIHSSISGNESDMVCTFTETDNKLGGSCKADDKEIQISGSVDGKKATWKYNSEYNGTPLTLTYSSTLDDPDKFSGTVDVQPFGVSGEFTATPSKEAAK